MGFKEAVSGYFERQREKKNEFKRVQNEVRMNKVIMERELSPQERELNKYMEEERQRRINAKVIKFRDNRTKQFMHGAPVYKQKNTITGHPSIMKQKNIFNGHKPIMEIK